MVENHSLRDWHTEENLWEKIVCDGTHTNTHNRRTLRLRDWIGTVVRISENHWKVIIIVLPILINSSPPPPKNLNTIGYIAGFCCLLTTGSFFLWVRDALLPYYACTSKVLVSKIFCFTRFYHGKKRRKKPTEIFYCFCCVRLGMFLWHQLKLLLVIFSSLIT